MRYLASVAESLAQFGNFVSVLCTSVSVNSLGSTCLSALSEDDE